MSNEHQLINAFRFLKMLKDTNQFVTDKTGAKMVECINMIAVLDPSQPVIEFPGRKTPEAYVQAELDWYLSQDLSIEKIGEKAKIWKDVASINCTVNSNYGWCIFSKDNYEQYEHCLKELINNRESRRAVMIYTRPSMQEDYCKDGMNDFICTNGVQCFIRNNRLLYLVHMRSNDAIYGMFNDIAWHCWVYNKLLTDLQKTYPELQLSNEGIVWNAGSFHVYERHFDMLDKICTFEG